MTEAQSLTSLPETEQVLLDYMRYAQEQIKRDERNIKRLRLMLDTCREQLIIQGHGDPVSIEEK